MFFAPGAYPCGEGGGAYDLFGAVGRLDLGPVAAGGLSAAGPVVLGGHRLLSALRVAAVAGGHCRCPAASEGAEEGERTHPAPGPLHRSGLHHRHRQHRRGGHRHLLRRTRRRLLDVGLRSPGDDDGLRGKDPGRLLPPQKPGRRLGGRPHGVHDPGPGAAASGPGLFPLLRHRLHRRRRSGPGQFHCRRPGARLRLGPAGSGGGHRCAHRSSYPRGHRPHRPGQRAAGARHGHSVPGGRRCRGSLPRPRPARGFLRHLPRRLCPKSRGGRRIRLLYGDSHALWGGPGGFHQRGRVGFLCHGPRRRRCGPPGGRGHVGDF